MNSAMRWLPWIFAATGGAVGVALGRKQDEGAFIAGTCAAAAYLLGALVVFLIGRRAETRVRRVSPAETQYSHDHWEEHKNTLDGDD